MRGSSALCAAAIEILERARELGFGVLGFGFIFLFHFRLETTSIATQASHLKCAMRNRMSSDGRVFGRKYRNPSHTTPMTRGTGAAQCNKSIVAAPEVRNA